MKKHFKILSFWAVWIISSAIGFIVGIIMVGYLQTAITEGMNEGIASFLTGSVFGLGMGISQWLSLRDKMRRAVIWIPLTALGFAAGCVTYWGLNIILDNKLWHGESELFENIFLLLIAVVVIGIPSGAIQSISLIDAKRLALFWIPVHTIGIVIALAVTFVYIGRFDAWNTFFPLLLVGSFYGVITGLPLAMALKLGPYYPQNINAISNEDALPVANSE
jgi:hypothetical protein